jgi:hypothetical protein
MKGVFELVCTAFVRVYPGALRQQYGSELRAMIHELSLRSEYRGIRGRLSLWMFLLRDVITTIAHQRVSALGWRSVPPAGRTRMVARPPYGDALLAFLGVLALYVATLAPAVAFWDAGEYLTAAHTLGIPHQPGNPLFVMLAHGWSLLLEPTGLSPAVRLNLFSAVLSAGAHFFWYLVVHRAALAITPDVRVRRLAAAAAVLLSATAFTVWNQSNVNEKVYTLSFLTVALISWLAFRWRDAGRSPRWLLLMVFLLALTSTNHLMGVLVAPAVLGFVLLVNGRIFLRARFWAGALGCMALGLTAYLFLPLRAAQQPIMNTADPSCSSPGQAVLSVYTWGRMGCPALSGAIRREQYGDRPITVDPTVYPFQRLPRSATLFAAQLANYAQYFNWQWARGLGGSDPLVGGLRPLVTVLIVLLGLLGARVHWKRDRAGALFLGTLFLTLSLGLVVYLNFEYGFAMARTAVPNLEFHEVRERDYFFLIGFSVWALWAGLGLTAAWQQLTGRLRGRVRLPGLAAAPVFAVALLPLGLNWQWASRADDYTARDWAHNVLMSVEPYGVLFTNGDNDTFPLWYLQEVEGIRRDVTVLVTSYLNTPWYVRQMRALSTPCPAGRRAQDAPNRIVCQRPFLAQQLPLPVRGEEVRLPTDSVLPLSDAQIDAIVQSYYVLREPIVFQAGAIKSSIPAGTELFPADTFVAAIVQANLGTRPIHFTTPAPAAQKLGLFDFTVRRGLTFQLRAPGAEEGAVPMPRNELSAVSGAYLDLPDTTTLLDRVFLRRGRLFDPSLPWVDRAAAQILLQYTWAHFSVAQALAARGEHALAQRHVERGEWWQRRASE